MENVLGKINMKEECFLKPVEKILPESNENSSAKTFILTDLTNTDIKKARRENYKQRLSQ